MNRKGIWLTAICLALFLSACGEAEGEEGLTPPQSLYEMSEHNTWIVQRGELSTELNLKVRPSERQVIQYFVMEDGMEIESINVSVGDFVKKGQILASFVSDDLKKERQLAKDHLDKCRLLYDHYSVLASYAEKEETKYYERELEKLQADIDYAEVLIEEANVRISACQIIAKEDGYISGISASMQGGQAVLSDNCISELVGDNTFQTQTTDLYEFQIGDSYEVSEGGVDYVLTIQDIQGELGEKRTITFTSNQPVTNQNAIFDIQIQKPVLTDAVYVRMEAVYHKDGYSYVYKVKENGYLEAVEVEVGETVDFFTVIKKGLEGGEEVAVR